MHSYPTLALVDQALGSVGPGFSTDDNAASLESYARALADEYWSETVWLTGRITEAAFHRVYEPLLLQWLALGRVNQLEAPVAPDPEVILVTVPDQILAPTPVMPSSQ